MTWKAGQPYTPEWTKIVWELVPYTRGRGIDLGSGPGRAFPHFIGVDNKKDTDLFTKQNQARPDVVAEASNMDMFASESLDFVFSSHLLEHIVDYKKVLRECWRVLKVGGRLVLYLPHKDFYPNLGKPGGNPDHKHDFLPGDITSAMRDVGSWDLIRNEPRTEDDEYSFFQVYTKLKQGSGCKNSYLNPTPGGKTCAVVRYGAWGDALQTSSVLAALKAEGYRITLYSTERAYEVLKSDPNIDSVYLQDTDQVPNHFLGKFWAHEEKKYDKWVNLSETVEGAWLPVPNNDVWHGRPYSVRKKYLDVNYIEFAHDVAEVPYTHPLVKFHPTLEERGRAVDFKAKLKGDPVILWALAGSSVHKIYPHIDQVLAWLMLTIPGCKVVTVGDEKCQLIENTKPGTGVPGAYLDWDKVPCVVKASGKVSIRDTLALAQISDLVIGPETGVLSAVCVEKMPKIVFLSHSSHNNLTRDWVNTFALFSTKTPCYPCHRLHYTWEFCHESKEIPGTADCQYDIPPQAVQLAIERALGLKAKPHIPLKVVSK
jgi:ADP-heptose:LPS heptosyltransferase